MGDGGLRAIRSRHEGEDIWEGIAEGLREGVIKEVAVCLDISIPNVRDSACGFQSNPGREVGFSSAAGGIGCDRLAKTSGDLLRVEVVEEKLRELGHSRAEQPQLFTLSEKPGWVFIECHPSPLVENVSLKLMVEMSDPGRKPTSV